MQAYSELTTHYLYLVQDVNNEWFVVGAAGLDVGVVVVATAFGTLHEYTGRDRNTVAREDVCIDFWWIAFCALEGQNSAELRGALRIGRCGYGAAQNS